MLIATSIWSLASRRENKSVSDNEEILLRELQELISETRAIIIGPIRQEILSGISSLKQFNLLREKLSFFENAPITSYEYELAAEFYNKCRAKGVQGSHIDFLVCAVAYRKMMAIFTNAKDFLHYARILELNLHSPRSFK